MAKKSNNKALDGGSLTEELAVSLNKKFSKEYNQVAYFLNGGEESPTDVTSWVSTGCTPLDLAISNRPNGGLPVSKIVEITGLEQSGKSLLAAHVIASTQKQDGVAIYIDTESALDAQFLTAIGVDVDKMLYIPLDTIGMYLKQWKTSLLRSAKSKKISWLLLLSIVLPQQLLKLSQQLTMIKMVMQPQKQSSCPNQCAKLQTSLASKKYCVCLQISFAKN